MGHMYKWVAKEKAIPSHVLKMRGYWGWRDFHYSNTCIPITGGLLCGLWAPQGGLQGANVNFLRFVPYSSFKEELCGIF